MTGFDAVQLSYDEPRADALHAQLERTLGGPVKRLHGVRGMRRAYRLCARISDTGQFFLADGDFAIDPDFDAGQVRALAGGVSMRVWQAVNPVNGLVYGYGGLKLVRRSVLLRLGEAADVLAALPGRIEFCPDRAGVTRFDQSPYHAWKAGFRECAMLARGSEYGMPADQAAAWIGAWTAGGSGPYAAFAAAGARDGLTFADERGDGPDRFGLLNDPVWLRQRFTAAHGDQPTCP